MKFILQAQSSLIVQSIPPLLAVRTEALPGGAYQHIDEPIRKNQSVLGKEHEKIVCRARQRACCCMELGIEDRTSCR